MVKDLLKSKAREGKTVFMSTHSLGVAEDICDRIGIINHGALIATGTTNDLKKRTGFEDADLEAVFLKLTEEQLPA
jgi:ABC-2 type transport system ATP-binding protein